MKDKKQGHVEILLKYASGIIATLREPFLILDKNLRVVSTNRAFSATFKVAEKETIGRSLLDLGDKQWDIPGLEKRLKEILPEKKAVKDYEVGHKFKKIGERVMILNARKLRVPGKIAAMLTGEKREKGAKEEELILLAIEDITGRRKAENKLKKYRNHLEEIVKEKTEAIKKAERIFRTIFASAREGLILADLQTKKFRMCNEAICNMLRCSEEELRRLGLHDIRPQEEAPQVMETFEKLAQGEMKMAESLPVKRKDGTIFYADISSFLLSLSGKKYLVGSFRDITERKKSEEAFLEAARIKSDFTSMVSHELRTPLASLQEAISLVSEGLEGEINKKQKEILDIANNNVTRLSKFINRVLDFQKFNAGKMEFHIEDNDINTLVKDVRDTMFPSVQKKGLGFILQLDENLPKIKFDNDRIVDVLLNLVNNSVKFTEKGSITVITRLGENFAQISVKDTGSGIKEEDMKRLFQDYEQIDRKSGGTGLGLAIAQKTIAAHGGKIWAESTFGEGTATHFVLPIREQRG